MSKLPQIRRLVAEDFPQQKEWIRPLFIVLNQFMESVISSINRNLTLTENLLADIKTVTLYSVPTSLNPITVQWTLNTVPKAIHIGNISGATLTTAVNIQWQYGTAGLQITNLVGVVPTNAAPVTLTLTAFTG